MARHANNKSGDELQRAAQDASSLLRARNDARRSGSAEPEASRGRVAEGGSRRGSSAKTEAESGTYERVSRPAQERGAHGKPPKKMTLFEYVTTNAVYIVGVAAVVAIVAVLLVTVRSCVPTETYEFEGELDFYQETPFNWENLQWTDEGRAVYIDDGKVRSKTGIDVSENQDEIDWEAVASDGIDFAMIRLGYRGATTGDLYVDPMFKRNLEGAKAAGVACGVYFFSQATSAKEAQDEVAFIVKNLGGVELEYPIALDYETAVAGVDSPRGANLGKDTMTEIADAFCKDVEKAGYKPIIYGNYYDLDLYNYESLQDRAVWWAEYDTGMPTPHLDITMWQYTNGGWVSGVPNAVDMNIDLTDVVD